MKGAIDIGTNTMRLLIGEIVSGKIQVKKQLIAEPRLGAGISKGEINKDAMLRGVKVLEEFQKITREFQVQKVSIVGTSALRDAKNKEKFLAKVLQRTGWRVEIISGEEEAALSYAGAVSALPTMSEIPVVIDIGGGSTEAIYQKSGQVQAISVNVGAVRYLEAGWSPKKLQKALTPLLAELIPLKEQMTLVAVGGTATTGAAIYLGMGEYSREGIQGQVISLENLCQLKDQLRGMTFAERVKVKGLSPQRADIIIPGLEILINIIKNLKKTEISISDAGLLDGIILQK